MPDTNGNQPAEDGFEYQGEFYRWKVTDIGKDLMLIDRFAGMPVNEFFNLVEDELQRGRAPVMLALIATSIRAEHPDWSVERIMRLVMDSSLADFVMVTGDQEELPELPPPKPGSTGRKSASASKPIRESTASVTSNATPG